MRIRTVMFALVVVLGLRAEVKVWTNLKGGGWSVAANWSPVGVPSPDDLVVITNAGSYTVSLDANASCGGLVLGGTTGMQTLATRGQTLTLNGSGLVAPGGELLLSGVLAGTNHLMLQGALAWLGGEIEVHAVVEVVAGGQLVVGGGANYARILRGCLTNAGTIVYKPPGPFGLAGPLQNRAGGLVEVHWDSRLHNSGPEGVFINDGVFRKSAGAAGFVCDVPFVNRGTVETQTGSLGLAGGSVLHEGSSFVGAGVARLEESTNVHRLNGAVYSDNLMFNGGTVSGAGTLSGIVLWRAGAIEAGATVLVATNGQLVIGGGANHARLLRGSLVNAGMIMYEPPGPLGLAGPLHNLAGGRFEIHWDSALFYSGPDGVFINDGGFRKSEGLRGAVSEVPFVNRGTVETQTGSLGLAGGSVLHEGSRFVGAGVARLEEGTNAHVLNGAVYSENLMFNGGTVSGAGTLSGTVFWRAGAIEAGATVLVATNGQLVIGGGANHVRLLRGSLANAGTIVYEPPGPLGLAGPLHNLAGGRFEIHWDSTLFNSGPDGAFINDGLFRKSEGVGSVVSEVPFVNRGTVEVPIGRLQFLSTYEQPSGDLVLRSGTVRSDQPLHLAGGRLVGWGTVEADVINAGARVRPASSNGVMTVHGNYTQGLAGYLDLVLGGSDPGVNQSQLRVSGAAQLNGTLDVEWAESYLPVPDDAFTVMTFSSCQGHFVSLNGLMLLGHDRRLVTVYGPKTLSLLTVAAPDPSGVRLAIGAEADLALVSWPLEFGGGTLWACTNVVEPEWILVPAPGNRFLDHPMEAKKYFRLQLP